LLVLLIVAIILGGIVSGVTGIGFLFWVVSIIIFVCGLPFALINGFIQDKIDYVQDREDERQLMRDLREDERRENERIERELDIIYKNNDSNIYIDSRHIHFHNNYRKYEQENEEQPIISNKKKKSRFDD